MSIKILHVAPIGALRHQGLFYAVRGLARAQSNCGARVELLTTHPSSRYDERENFPVIYHREVTISDFFLPLEPSREKYDLIVIHSTYIPLQARIASLAFKCRIPYILTPHGGMTRGAVEIKKWKKKLGNLFFFSRMVENCRALHFLTEGEARESFGWNRPQFIVGNGIDIPQITPELLEKRGHTPRLNLLFLGRLDPQHKGLDILLEGLSLLQGVQPNANLHLQLYGPSAMQGDDRMQALIRMYCLEKWVEVMGPIYGENKERVLSAADAFVLTSRFEGHPISVLEALANGLPCLVTPGTNVADEVVEAGAGWKVAAEPQAVAEGIACILRDRKRLPIMARKARAMAANQYGWESVGQRTLAKYAGFLEQ